MLRMEIALLLVVAFIAFNYFTAEKDEALLHKAFEGLIVCVMANLLFDGITVYTVNNLNTVPLLLNNVVHRFFLGSMVAVIFLFYRYIAIIVQDETGKPRMLDSIALAMLVLALLGNFLLPIEYTVTEHGNYSSGPYMYVPYAAVAFYLSLCIGLLVANRREISPRKRNIIGTALAIEVAFTILQGLNHTWLISGLGMTLMTLSFYLTLENPEALRRELTEQRLSMLYLKSQVNPHFLYNTLDTIRIQAQLNGDNQTASLLMRLVDFFRLSVKVDRPMVTLDDEMELLEAYMDLMCYRYPELSCSYDIDPELGEQLVPNFILQPLVENSLLHGLKNKGYHGEIDISCSKEDDRLIISIKDTGTGFDTGKKEIIDNMLINYDRQPPKLTGGSIGVLNVQKRIKLLCGKDYGLHYTDNPDGGVTAHITLPMTK
ncbi:MAG: histidine kinase [Firmicutes bacterium]|nr:histidine kinase [Bacillota bacterium]